jgi:hypothetical protein
MASKRTFGGIAKATTPLQELQAHDRNKEGSLGNHLVLVGMSQKKMDDMWWHVFRHAKFLAYNDHWPRELVKAMKKMLQDAQPGKDTIKDFLMLIRSFTLDKGHNCPMFSPFASTSLTAAAKVATQARMARKAKETKRPAKKAPSKKEKAQVSMKKPRK